MANAVTPDDAATTGLFARIRLFPFFDGIEIELLYVTSPPIIPA
jgi:hypothetical protein